MDGCDRQDASPRPERREPPAAPASARAVGPAGSPLLALQRQAGNRAVNHLLQRKMGFEFEIDVPVVGAGVTVDDDDDRHEEGFRWLTGRGLRAKTPLKSLDGAGYHVETDHGHIGDNVSNIRENYQDDPRIATRIATVLGRPGPANVEYVTDPIEERGEDADEQFTRQIAAVQASMEGLRALTPADVLHERDGYQVGIPDDLPEPQDQGGEPIEYLGDFDEDVRDARDAVSFRSYVQATAGIGPARVSAFVLAQDDDDLGPGTDDEVGRQTRAWLGEVDAILDGRVDPEARGFYTVLLQYTVGLAIAVGTGLSSTEKNITPFWLKLDPARYRTSLPRASQLVIHQTQEEALARLLNVYDEELTAQEPDETKHRDLDFNLSQFLRGSLTGESSGIEGLQFKAPNTDVPGGGIQFELRSISAEPAPGELLGVVRAIVAKIRGANA